VDDPRWYSDETAGKKGDRLGSRPISKGEIALEYVERFGMLAGGSAANRGCVPPERWHASSHSIRFREIDVGSEDRREHRVLVVEWKTVDVPAW